MCIRDRQPEFLFPQPRARRRVRRLHHDGRHPADQDLLPLRPASGGVERRGRVSGDWRGRRGDLVDPLMSRKRQHSLSRFLQSPTPGSGHPCRCADWRQAWNLLGMSIPSNRSNCHDPRTARQADRRPQKRQHRSLSLSLIHI